MSGYSGTPLIKKLGIKPNFRLAFVHEPANYQSLLGELPEETLALEAGDLDFIHAFFTERAEFEAEYATLKAALRKNGMLWISWPKKASKVKTDISEDIIRDYALTNGLVDVKVAAVDEIWSALKLVYRLEDR